MAQEIVFCCFQSLLGKKLGNRITPRHLYCLQEGATAPPPPPTHTHTLFHKLTIGILKTIEYTEKVTGVRARQLIRTKSDYLYAIFWLYTRPSFETWFSDKSVVLSPPLPPPRPELVD